jgi:hypothetical protein
MVAIRQIQCYTCGIMCNEDWYPLGETDPKWKYCCSKCTDIIDYPYHSVLGMYFNYDSNRWHSKIDNLKTNIVQSGSLEQWLTTLTFQL